MLRASGGDEAHRANAAAYSADGGRGASPMVTAAVLAGVAMSPEDLMVHRANCSVVFSRQGFQRDSTRHDESVAQIDDVADVLGEPLIVAAEADRAHVPVFDTFTEQP